MTMRHLATVLVFSMLVGWVGQARADVMTPPGLAPGQQFRMVFVTTTTTTATSSNIATYDAVVQGDATAAGLGAYQGSPVTWEAIGSTATVSAISRLPADNVPIYLPDGTEVAAGGLALWSTSTTNLLHSIDETAGGTLISDFTWTGTVPSGAPSTVDYLGSGSSVIGGETIFITAQWTDASPFSIADGFPLYEFSSVLTVPAAPAPPAPPAVPEPGTLTLVLVGLGELVATRWCRRGRDSSPRPASSPPAHS